MGFTPFTPPEHSGKAEKDNKPRPIGNAFLPPGPTLKYTEIAPENSGFPLLSTIYASSHVSSSVMESRESLVATTFPVLQKLRKLAAGEGADGTEARPLNSIRLVSVVIPAHNEEDYIAGTLEALHAQDYGWHEIIVVANGCTDRTAEIARGKCNRLIVLSQKNLGVARNLGARMAKGEILMFLDADTILEPDALRKIVARFTPSCAAGTLKGRPDNKSFSYRLIYALKNLVHRCYLHPGSSGVILCWRKHFIQTGGFDEGLQVRENSELIRRLMRFGRYKYFRTPAATTSMRRYAKRGIGPTVWLWIKLWFQSQFGDLHNRTYETVR